jgi:uncharacterized protein involved in exopolysaccharide biosynthesis
MDQASPLWTITRRDALSLRDLADVLFRKKLWLAAGLLLVLASAAAFVALSPPRYRSDMLFLVKNDRPDTGLTSNNTVTFVSRELQESQMGTEVQLLTSDELLSSVLVKLGTVKDPSNGPAMERALRKLRKELRVTPGLKSTMISVSVTADSAAGATSLLNTLASSYLEKHLAIHKVAGGLEFFRGETARTSEELESAQNTLAQFDESHNTVQLDQQKTQKVKNLADLETAYSEAIAAQKDSQSRSDALQTQLSAAAPRITTQSRTVPNQYSAERLNTMLVELNNKRTELLTKFQPTDRMVQEVDQQIAQTSSALEETRREVSKEEATDVNPLRQTLQADLLQSDNRRAGLSGRAAALRIQILQARTQLDGMSKVTGQHDDLIRAVKDAETHYQALSTQFEQAKLDEQMDRERMANMAVAEAPTQTNVPEPRIDINMIAAATLGVLLVIGMVLMSGMRRSQVFTPWELEGLIGAPVLGAIPLAARKTLPPPAGLALTA